MEDQFKREIQEAVQAADHALACLRQADAYLQSAKNWGLFDMLGGGALTTFFKHSKIDDPIKEIIGKGQKLSDLQFQLKTLIDIRQFFTKAL